MFWPQSLVLELAARRCIVFLGAGVSAGCISESEKSPPDWKNFLYDLKEKMRQKSPQSYVEGLIKSEKYLDAAEIIVNNIEQSDLSAHIRETFVTPRFEPSEFHKIVLEIDPKVVITTNYDDIYDTYCRTGIAKKGYNVCRYYETHIGNDLRSPIRLIAKMHGCVNDPTKIILSRSQYFRAKQEYGQFYNVLNALFMTNTVLFLGYSLSDPDMQLLLENTNISAPSAHKHFALIPNNLDTYIENALSCSYNVSFLKYTDHGAAVSLLHELKDQVITKRRDNPNV